MEKRTAHCRLTTVHALMDAGRCRVTGSATAGARAMELDVEDVLEVVRSLSPQDFYKSMTTYDNHRVWQDVYRPTTKVGRVYLKLTVIDDVLVVSFKEL